MTTTDTRDGGSFTVTVIFMRHVIRAYFHKTRTNHLYKGETVYIDGEQPTVRAGVIKTFCGRRYLSGPITEEHRELAKKAYVCAHCRRKEARR